MGVYVMVCMFTDDGASMVADDSGWCECNNIIDNAENPLSPSNNAVSVDRPQIKYHIFKMQLV